MNSIKQKILKDRLFEIAIIFFTALSVLPLILILFQVVKNGIGAINLEFFTHLPLPPGEKGGGILNAIVGSFELVFIASIFAIPLGVLIGVFLAEYKNKLTDFLTVLVDVLQSTPSIVIGIIAYLWVVVPLRRFSALSGSVALAIMMLPLIIKHTKETLKMVPSTLKEASYALGANYTSTLLKVLLPSALGGILTGILLSISRVFGETAPLLFTAFGNPFFNINPLKSVESLPLLIFKYALSPYDDWHRIAWGASLVLILIVLSLNILVKLIIEKWEARF